MSRVSRENGSENKENSSSKKSDQAIQQAFKVFREKKPENFIKQLDALEFSVETSKENQKAQLRALTNMKLSH